MRATSLTHRGRRPAELTPCARTGKSLRGVMTTEGGVSMKSFRAMRHRRGGSAGASHLRAIGLIVVVVTATLAVVAAGATPSSFVELDGNVISNATGTYDWANSGALTTTGNTYSRAGSGGLFDGGHFNGNNTPPTAPARTAAAAADSSIADAEFKVDP